MPDTQEKIPLTAHFITDVTGAGPVFACGERGGFTGTTDVARVTCFRCRKTAAFQAAQIQRDPVTIGQALGELPVGVELRRRWTVAVVGGDTEKGYTDWLKGQGVGVPTPTLNIPNCHRPPVMNDNEDGVFLFHDVHLDGNTLEVVPQTTGNVEITIEYEGEARFVTLSHLDRIDLVRALLHDFHYSPERGGPNEDV